MRLSARRSYQQLRFFTSMFHWMCFAVNSLYYIQIVHMTPLQLVLTGTVLELSILLLEIPTGVVADVFSRRLSILIGLFLTGIGFFLQGVWPNFWVILLAQVIWGAGFTFTSGATEAWITDETDEDVAASLFMRGEQVGLIGAVLGIGFGMSLGLISFAFTIKVSGVVFLFLTLYFGLTMVETGFHPIPQTKRTHIDSMIHTIKNGAHLTRVHPGLLGIFAIGFFFGLYSEGVDRLWEARMVDGFTFPLFEPVIWFGLIHIAGMLLGSLSLGLLQKWKYATDLNQSIWLQSFLSVGIIAGLFIFAATGNFYIAALMIFLITIFREVHYPLYTGWVNRKLDSSVRATVLSMASLVDASGQISGGPLVGSIATRMGIPFGLTISALLLAPVLPFYAFLYRKLNSTTKSEQA